MNSAQIIVCLWRNSIFFSNQMTSGKMCRLREGEIGIFRQKRANDRTIIHFFLKEVKKKYKMSL